MIFLINHLTLLWYLRSIFMKLYRKGNYCCRMTTTYYIQKERPLKTHKEPILWLEHMSPDKKSLRTFIKQKTSHTIVAAQLLPQWSQWRHWYWPSRAILLSRCHSKHFHFFWNLWFLWQIFSLGVTWKQTSKEERKKKKKGGKKTDGLAGKGRALLLLTEKWHVNMVVIPYLIPWLRSHKRDLIIASSNQSPQCIKFALEQLKKSE